MKLKNYPGEYQKIIDFLNLKRFKKVMVIGGIDSGKTSLIKFMVEIVSEKFRTTIVDLDVGQSHIGPPTTIGWAKVPKIRGKDLKWKHIKPERLYFTGVLTPSMNLQSCIVGSKIITDDASSKSEKVIIDTTGLISGTIGRILKISKIELIKPDLIIALERGNELAHVLKPFKYTYYPEIIRLPVINIAREKSAETRTKYRLISFKRYFNNKMSLNLSIGKISILFLWNKIENPDDIPGYLASIEDKHGKTLAVGVITNFNDKYITIDVPSNRYPPISMVKIGKVKYPEMQKT